ncbi:hypothetical protein C9374_004321 [Naegleria lovaniensis]|uniref:Uncharacterized protein n=1 Tax=Naegleria lovaniensis TaxID=51637 RepID=A0AA88GNG9_NAELO|nr:uncharacterized protein C9374_004321 [Naegleria lovaniensis]KAG2383650.1 hypothetical protein C9374_004321 [Naegleria lovaniensis]
MFGAINDQKDVADVMLMDLNDCLKKQWEMHVQSSSEKFRNDEFQKEATAQKGSLEALRDINSHIFNVEERYSNDSALVKQWITSDQEEEEQRKKKKLQSSEHENNNSSVEQQQEENILQLIRQRLDDNSKYDILEYIPTYSRWSVFEQEGTYRKYLQAIKYPFLSRTMALPHHLEYHLIFPSLPFTK